MSGHPKVKETLDKVWKIHQQKNSDYSNADHSKKPDVFSNFRMCEDFNVKVLDGILVRMSDKWSRAVNIHAKGGKNAVPGEGLEDAFIDLIGYAAIYLAELSDQQDKKESEEYIKRLEEEGILSPVWTEEEHNQRFLELTEYNSQLYYALTLEEFDALDYFDIDPAHEQLAVENHPDYKWVWE